MQKEMLVKKEMFFGEEIFLKEEMFRSMIMVLLVAVFLFMLFFITVMCQHVVRIYNWDGTKYNYLGYAPIRKENGGRAIHISEKMVDLSHTTSYQLVFGKTCFQKHRYRELFVYAKQQRNYLVIEAPVLKTEIPF